MRKKEWEPKGGNEKNRCRKFTVRGKAPIDPTRREDGGTTAKRTEESVDIKQKRGGDITLLVSVKMREKIKGRPNILLSFFRLEEGERTSHCKGGKLRKDEGTSAWCPNATIQKKGNSD